MSNVSPRSTWEADVVLNDGGIATLRPVTPADRDKILEFYTRVSDHSKYLRFFSTHPSLTDADLSRWLDTDGYDHVTLVLEQRDDIVAIAGYELVPQLLPARVGNVAFLVQDSHHSRGVGNILLEHLADIGREGGVERFVAEMLTQNRQMVQVFIRAGYSVQPELADGFISVDFDIAPNARSREVMERRELRAEAASIHRLLHPATVAVVGDVQLPPHWAGAAREVAGSVDAAADGASRQAETADLVVCTDPQLRGIEAISGVVVLANSRNPGMPPEQSTAIMHVARDHGFRALGPASLGIINPHTGLNASSVPLPRRGATGLFTQSAGVGTLTLSRALERGCGVSSFISAGFYGDVTGNDVIQYWSADETTRVCLLSLDTIGNPRKFFRVLRRLALEKHVVVFVPSRALASARHHVAPGLPAVAPHVLDSVIRDTGAMVVSRRDTMFDIAQILARQPAPRGRRVAVISNSNGLTVQMARCAQRFGLRPRPVTVYEDPVDGLAAHAAAALEDPTIDAVVCAVVEVGTPISQAAHARLEQLAAAAPRPLIATFAGFERLTPDYSGPEEPGQLPTCETYADALEALSLIIGNEQRRELACPRPEDEVAEGDLATARALADAALATAAATSPTSATQPAGATQSAGVIKLDDATCAAILATYGIDIVPWTAVQTVEEAIAAGAELEGRVVLKCVSPTVRGRSELPTVIRNIGSPEQMRAAWSTLERLVASLRLGDDPAVLEPVVQCEVEAGASLSVRAVEDPVLGPMIGVGVAGLATDLLGDEAWRVPPVRRTDALTMLSELKAGALLQGYRGTKPANVHAVEDIIMKLARLKDDIADIVEVELVPVVAGIDTARVVGARMTLAPLGTERDPLARQL